LIEDVILHFSKGAKDALLGGLQIKVFAKATMPEFSNYEKDLIRSKPFFYLVYKGIFAVDHLIYYSTLQR